MNFLFRWFIGLSKDDAAWGHSVFCKNRERLASYNLARMPTL